MKFWEALKEMQENGRKVRDAEFKQNFYFSDGKFYSRGGHVTFTDADYLADWELVEDDSDKVKRRADELHTQIKNLSTLYKRFEMIAQWMAEMEAKVK